MTLPTDTDPTHPSASPDAWARCWAELGATRNGAAVHAALLAAWREPQRRYHTLQHLDECLALFATVRGLAERPAEVEAAIWFHDAVYDVAGPGNEEQSAAWAEAAIAGDGGAPGAVAARIGELVMATKHHVAAANPDARLLVDIDLAILAAPPARFAEYERQIRDEYAHVPEATFVEKRSAVLRSFLARDRIYGTQYVHDALEARARVNLAEALAGASAMPPAAD